MRVPRRLSMFGGNSGSSALETLIVLLLVGSALTAGAVTLVVGFSRVWLSHCTYEAAICLAERQPRSACELKLTETVLQVFPGGAFRSTRIRETPFAYIATAEFEPMPRLARSILKLLNRPNGVVVKSDIAVERTKRGLIR